MTNKGIYAREVVEWEEKILLTLNFEFNFPTTLDFLEIYADVLEFDELTENIAHYLAESTLYITKSYQINKSLLASACCFIADCFRN